MKPVKYIVNLIIIPLATLIFLTVGLIAALVSALIEYSVVKGFFTSAHQELISSATVAFLLVFVFEFTKLFLHFVQKRQAVILRLSKGMVAALVTVLVTFSFVCSVIFTVTTLYLPAYDKGEVEGKVTAVDTQLKMDIENVKKEYTAEYETSIQPFKEAMDRASGACTEPVPDDYGPIKTDTYMKMLQEAAANATREYFSAADKFSLIRDQKIEAAVAELTRGAEERKASILNTDSPEIAVQYDNPVISKFLTVLANILFHTAGYSRQAYLWMCVLLGIMISVILEVIISVSSQFLAVPMEFLTEDMGNVNARIRKGCQECVITLFKAFGAVTIYIIILSCCSESMEREKICLGLIACMLSIFLTHRVLPVPQVETNKWYVQFFFEIRDCIVQGVVSLMGFVLLGFLFGNDALKLDVNTIAVGIGSALSGGIIQIPQSLLAGDIKASAT